MCNENHFFLFAIRRCSLVRVLYALGQQPVLTIEYLKGEFDFVPNLAGFSGVVRFYSVSFVSYFEANAGWNEARCRKSRGFSQAFVFF